MSKKRKSCTNFKILNQTVPERYKINRMIEHDTNIKLCLNYIVKYKRKSNMRDAAADVGTTVRLAK